MANKNSIRYVVNNAQSIFRQLRWHGTVKCPYCGCTHIYNCATKYKCHDCHKMFTDFTNTIMHGTNLDASAWILCLYLMLDSRGISSVEVARKVGVTQKTAWKMMMKWRLAMSQDSVELSGTIAMDEAYIGGSWSNKPLSKQQELMAKFIPNKFRAHHKLTKTDYFKLNALIHTPVFAMNDGHNVVFKVLPRGFNKTDIQDIFTAHTSDVDLCVSDCSKLYDEWDVPFEHNNHSRRQYTTPSGYSSNSIEGFFSHFKRALRHNHIFMSQRYMQLYLDEMAFRWRHRLDEIRVKMDDAMSNANTRPHLNDLQPLPNKDIPEWQIAQNLFDAIPIAETVTINKTLYEKPPF